MWNSTLNVSKIEYEWLPNEIITGKWINYGMLSVVFKKNLQCLFFKTSQYNKSSQYNISSDTHNLKSSSISLFKELECFTYDVHFK
jgi:hypothetical protein